MLHKETVSPLLLEILQRLFSYREMDEFVLVGETALSLRIGHRKSIDIDLLLMALFLLRSYLFFSGKMGLRFISKADLKEEFLVS